MTATEKDLLALEKKFWTGDSKFYRDNVDDSCLIAFGADMAGVMSNKDVAASAKDGNRWRNLELELKGLIEPSDDVAILSYEAHATRGNGEPYSALVSTGYAKRDDGWKMMFHQQTPLEACASFRATAEHQLASTLPGQISRRSSGAVPGRFRRGP